MKKFKFSLLLLVSLLFIPSSVVAELCEQHDFGSPNLTYYVYSDGETWDFDAENDMIVSTLEVMTITVAFPVSGLPGYYSFEHEIKINDISVASWISAGGTKTHSENVTFELTVGDKITYKISGGFGFEAAGTISGPNYIRLCDPEQPRISISPDSFNIYSLDVIESFDSPGDDPKDLAFDGTYLWNADYDSNKIYKIDTTGNIIDSIDSPGSGPNGLAFDGNYLWNADSGDDKIYKIDTTGNIIDSIDSPGSVPKGLAFDGNYLWNADSGDDKIYKIDTTGNILDSIDSPGNLASGLTFDGTYLWNADTSGYNPTVDGESKIYKLDTSGKISQSFDPFSWLPEGIAFDGTYLWHSDDGEDKIYKMRSRTINTGSSTNQIFTVTNTGSKKLDIGTIVITGNNASEFSIENDTCSNKTIQPAGTCSFDGIFSPKSEGQKSACLKITSNDPDTAILNVPFGDDPTQCDSNGDTSTTTTIGQSCPIEKLYGGRSEETELLRYYRDAMLSQTTEGQELIKLYYQWSPVIVQAMENDEKFKEDVKEMVDGVLELIVGGVG